MPILRSDSTIFNPDLGVKSIHEKKKTAPFLPVFSLLISSLLGRKSRLIESLSIEINR